MVAITLRADLSRGLTNAEIDANFSNLKTAVEAAALSAAWANLTGKPTTLSGYGITDAQSALVSGTSIKTVNGQSVLGSGNIQIDGGVTSFNTRTGAITLGFLDVRDALGYAPYNATNPAGFINGITGAMVTTALGFTPENAANKAQANGYASLDATGKVPAAQLPSFVDDVLEYASVAAFPATGETGKIYVNTSATTNNTYRWGGSSYVLIAASPGSTDSVTEGATNLYFTTARARAAISASGSLSYNASTGVVSYTAPTVLSAFTNDSGYITASATVTGSVASTGGDFSIKNSTSNSAANTWHNRTGVINAGADRAVFLGTYGSYAIVGAHNSALYAWADLFVNTSDGSNGGTVRLPTSTLVAGNQALHAGNYSSYAPTFLGNYERTNNARMVGNGVGAMGICGTDSGGNWRYQLYGDGASFGFLNSLWGGWAIKSDTSGNFTAAGSVTASQAGFQSATYSTGRNRIWSFGNADGYGVSYFQGSGGYGGADSIGMHFGTASAAGSQFTFASSGAFIATGNVTAYSDETLKTNWEDIGPGYIEALANVKHGTYTRIDTGERQAGTSAQAWLKLLPEVVGHGEKLSLAYGNAALVSAIQLARRVVELERRLKALGG